ncbi:MAG TPA: cation:proton antiporter, partial [Thermoanaerobaculia bacterium]|nr:cation:proton antiporter [Thermoanaerobaculia bacterium]
MRQSNRFSLLALSIYALMLAGAILAFLWIRQQGSTLTAPPPVGPGFGAGAAPGTAGAPAAASRGAGDVLPHVLLALAVILVAARAVGLVFRRLGQPPVVGEVVAGILLGPSLLGRISPAALAFLLPPAV